MKRRGKEDNNWRKRNKLIIIIVIRSGFVLSNDKTETKGVRPE